ncbi:unnamed protein product [Dovyalis caffra]|uniref:Uncharacterized protein n=1 Tax=Dovyalis caffra TaxID=77055 RepID=A0AAV1RZA6_9ROSI|nr:unnamed protein product [Dovyalis caffra]
MALRINDQNGVSRGTPHVQPNDNLFWFGKEGRSEINSLHFLRGLLCALMYGASKRAVPSNHQDQQYYKESLSSNEEEIGKVQENIRKNELHRTIPQICFSTQAVNPSPQFPQPLQVNNSNAPIPVIPHPRNSRSLTMLQIAACKDSLLQPHPTSPNSSPCCKSAKNRRPPLKPSTSPSRRGELKPKTCSRTYSHLQNNIKLATLLLKFSAAPSSPKVNL